MPANTLLRLRANILHGQTCIPPLGLHKGRCRIWESLWAQTMRRGQMAAVQLPIRSPPGILPAHLPVYVSHIPHMGHIQNVTYLSRIPSLSGSWGQKYLEKTGDKAQHSHQKLASIGRSSGLLKSVATHNVYTASTRRPSTPQTIDTRLPCYYPHQGTIGWQ